MPPPPPRPISPPIPAVLPTYPDLRNKVALITGIGQVGSPDSTTWVSLTYMHHSFSAKYAARGQWQCGKTALQEKSISQNQRRSISPHPLIRTPNESQKQSPPYPNPPSPSQGNGAAITRLLASNNVKIHACDLSLAAATRTKTRILSEFPHAEIDIQPCDVTSPPEIAAFVRAAVQKHGRIDILVNNVGMTAPGSAETLSPEVWDAQIALNLTSVYALVREVLPVMLAQEPQGKPQIAYATAKAGVLAFTRATGAEYAGRNVRVNAVVPGLMFTPLVENLVQSGRAEEREVGERIVRHNVPMGWMGRGEDVANAVGWLASGVSRYVTCQAVVVDGGITESTGTGFEG
ncbi:hypothetical protein Q7P37_006116 [Cladosporium fusiforme]